MIAAAFGVFLVRSMIAGTDYLLPDTLELVIAAISFAGVALFLFALLDVKKYLFRRKSIT